MFILQRNLHETFDTLLYYYVLQPQLYITEYSRSEEEVTGSQFYLEYDINDQTKNPGPYEIRVSNMYVIM